MCISKCAIQKLIFLRLRIQHWTFETGPPSYLTQEMKILIATITFVLFATPSFAQDYSADTETVGSTITALYASISGPAGEARDWDRFRNLFAPGAQLIPVVTRGDTTRAAFNSIEGYINLVSNYFEQNGFFEIEVSRKIERYGHILHAFSTYESRTTEEDEQPFARGINSIQLMHDGNRWWVVNVMWDDERGSGETIPQTYLDN